MTSNIAISVGFAAPPSDPPAFPGMDGGLRVEVGHVVLTGADNQEQLDSYYDHYDSRGRPVEHPDVEYVGEYVSLQAIEAALMPFLDGSAERFGEYEAELMAAPGEVAIVLSALDGDLIRLAAKPTRDETVRDFPVEAMLGVTVEPSDVASALVEAYQQCVDYVERAYDSSTFGEEIAEFKQDHSERIKRLEQQIESANQD